MNFFFIVIIIIIIIFNYYYYHLLLLLLLMLILLRSINNKIGTWGKNFQMEQFVYITLSTHPNICPFITFMTFLQCDEIFVFIELEFIVISQVSILHNVSSFKELLESEGIQLFRTARAFETDIISSLAFQ